MAEFGLRRPPDADPGALSRGCETIIKTHYEAAVVLLTFVLFGHWLEMRARAGASNAMKALLDLTPPKATVIRNGEPVEIPPAEVVIDDVVLIKPGDKVPAGRPASKLYLTCDSGPRSSMAKHPLYLKGTTR